MSQAKPSILNIPNYLTVLRIVSIPFILFLLQSGKPRPCLWATLIFTAAFVTDWLDGFIARKKNLVTQVGKILDPLADKLLIGGSLIMLIGLDRVEAWIGFLIIGREIAITWLRAMLASKGQIVAASRLGKNKTFFQAVALIPLLIHYSYFNLNFQLLGTALLWIALVLTLWSGVAYFTRYYSLIMEKVSKT